MKAKKVEVKKQLDDITDMREGELAEINLSEFADTTAKAVLKHFKSENKKPTAKVIAVTIHLAVENEGEGDILHVKGTKYGNNIKHLKHMVKSDNDSETADEVKAKVNEGKPEMEEFIKMLKSMQGQGIDEEDVNEKYEPNVASGKKKYDGGMFA